MPTFLCLALVTITVFLSLGCSEVKEQFSGLIGRVAIGPVEGAVVKVYDGSRFVGFDNDAGFITQTVTDERGDFKASIPDGYIGRTLIVAAEFLPDNVATPDDDRAFYLDFSDPAAEIRLDPADGPWVSMVELFSGLSVEVSVTPWTTMAFNSLSSLPAEEVGPGNTRYTQGNARQCDRTLGVSIGFTADLSGTLPAQPDLGLGHPVAKPTKHDSTDSSAGLLYTLVQLDRAAAAFAADTADGSDDQMDFISACFDDARDGLLDGQLNGEPMGYFASAGAPDVLGLDADGKSKLIQYVATADTIDADMADAIAVNGTFPEIADILALQNASTGAIRTVRVDDIETQFFPHGGGASVTVRGAGFVSAARVVLASNAKLTGAPSGSTLTIDDQSEGTAGEILEVSNNAITFLSPDLDADGIGAGFSISSAASSRELAVFLRFVLDGKGRNKIDRFAGKLSQLTDGGLRLLDARIVRLDASGAGQKADALINVLPNGTDPDALDPATDDVYALQLTAFNAGDTAIESVRLSLGATTAEGNGGAIVLDSFGGSENAPALIFESLAVLTTDVLDLAAGESGTLTLPFVFDEDEVGVGGQLDFGEGFTLTPVITGSIDSTPVASNDDDLPSPTASARLLLPDQTPVVTAAAPVVEDATVAAGDAAAIDWTLDVAGRVGATHRAARITRVTLTIAPESETASTFIFDSLPLGALPATGTSITLESLELSTTPALSTSGTMLPLDISGDSATLSLSLGTDADYAGDVDVTLSIEWAEPATGASGTLTDTATFTVNP